MTDIRLVVKIDADVYTRLFDNEIATDDICEMARALRLGKPYEERKTGKWIVWKDCEGKTRELTCSECGCQRRTWVNPNYCEDCGAKMEVNNEESH